MGVDDKTTPKTKKVKQRKNRLTGEEFGPVSQGAQNLEAMDSILKKGIDPIASSIANTTSRNVRGIADILGKGIDPIASSIANTTSRNVRGIADILGMGTASGASNSSGDNANLADKLMRESLLRDNNILVPPEISSGAYSPYGSGSTDNSTLEALRNAIADRQSGRLLEDEGPRSEGPGLGQDGWMAQLPETLDRLAREANDRNASADSNMLRQAARKYDPISTTNPLFQATTPITEFSSGPSAESLSEQLANIQRGGAQGRYDEVLKFLGTEGARRNTQMDSDEAAILKQLQGSDSRRRAGEDFYRDRRAGEFGELEGRMNTYQSAGSRRLIDLGIDPQLYTSAVGQQMGTLLGAQMQSGNDLMNRMAMVGAERAEGAMGRASAGMSKERRSLDASVASMMFEGSQTLSMELQSINEALMNRRIDAATAQQAIDQSTQKARQSMMQNEAIGQALGLQEGMGSALGEQGYLGKFIDQDLKPADLPEAVQIVTQDLIDQNSLPQNLIGQPMNISQLQKWANLGKTTAQTNEMTGFN